MSRPPVGSVLRIVLGSLVAVAIGSVARAQEAPPPAYLAVVEGTATLERDGEAQPAVVNMPFVTGDRLRTAAGRVEIDFPDGTTIEVAAYSEVEAVSPTRVRVLAGTIDHLQRQLAEAPSATYLPQDLQRYGDTFDRSGSWQYTAPYGYVWYPRVTQDWRPYYYGSWAPVPSYGWTWIGVDTWSWPTHHYGRWGYGRNAWFWIPGRTWGAAWVSWASASDYVSWCPLGYDGRPVFGYSVFGADSGWRFRTGLDHRWNGWTVMPRRDFGAHGAYTPHYEVDPRRIASDTPFIVQARAPVALPHATSSSTVTSPGASAGFAIPRVGGREPIAVGRDRNPRPAPTGTPPATDDRRPGEYRRGPAVAMPRVAMPRVETPRMPETPRASAPEGTRMGGAPPTPRVMMPPPAQQPTNGYRTPPATLRPPTTDYRRSDEPRAAPSYGAPSRSAPVERAVPRSAAPPERSAPVERAVPRLEAPAERSAPVQRAAPQSAAPAERAAPPPRSAPAGAPHEGGARERSGGAAPTAGPRRPR